MTQHLLVACGVVLLLLVFFDALAMTLHVGSGGGPMKAKATREATVKQRCLPFKSTSRATRWPVVFGWVRMSPGRVPLLLVARRILPVELTR